MSGFDILGPGSFERPKLMGDDQQVELIGKDSLIGQDGLRGREVGGDDFSAQLENALGQVKELSDDVKNKYEALARGDGGVEIHDLMTAMGKSEVAFNMMLEVRNKIVDAWETLSRSVV